MTGLSNQIPLAFEKFWPAVRIQGLNTPLLSRSGFPWPSGDTKLPFASTSGYASQT
jgi:hypothetical protein